MVANRATHHIHRETTNRTTYPESLSRKMALSNRKLLSFGVFLLEVRTFFPKNIANFSSDWQTFLGQSGGAAWQLNLSSNTFHIKNCTATQKRLFLKDHFLSFFYCQLYEQSRLHHLSVLCSTDSFQLLTLAVFSQSLYYDAPQLSVSDFERVTPICTLIIHRMVRLISEIVSNNSTVF